MVYSVSYSPLGWSLPTKVFPNSKQAKGVALATYVNWLSNFIIGIAVPPMLKNIQFGFYVFFTFFYGLAGIWALLLVPETKGKTLEEIDLLFGDGGTREEMEILQAATSVANQIAAKQHV